ncbi:MAG: hypothetical protein ABI666_08005 [Ferruginibacter sp.]
MKFILFFFTVILFSCNQSSREEQDNSIVVATPKKIVQPEDSATAKIRSVVSSIVTDELKFTSPVRTMTIDSVRYEMTSLKDYYLVQKEELSKEAHLSTNKEKTNKALAYLDKLIANAPAEPVVYKVQFHLNAQLANGVIYNEGHTKYLKQNLSEIQIVFP